MEGGGGLPLLNCLWQQALRSFCSLDSSTSSRWVYAVFWRILPRNYPPPRWDEGRGLFDRSNGNKRNWILVWEDGFCDFYGCERSGNGFIKFGPDIFFKMSHEVYNYGEGLIGKVAADNSHKWVFREAPSENDPNFFSSSNGSLDPQPRAWDSQFSSGIQTIAIIAVREGVVQLGSLDKVSEDLNLVISIQRKFNYLQSMPGVFAMQRPYPAPSDHHANALKQKFHTSEMVKSGVRCSGEKPEELLFRSINLGWNDFQNNSVFRSIPPLLPPNSCSLGVLLSKLPSVTPSVNSAHEVCSGENNGILGPNLFCGFDQILDVKPTIFDTREAKNTSVSPYSSQSIEESISLQQQELQVQGDEQGNVSLVLDRIIR